MSNDSTPPMNKIVVQTLIKGLEEAKNTMQGMQKQIHSMELTLTELKSQNDNMANDVAQMVKIIRDGNGKAPLIERVGKLESKTDTFDPNKINKLESKIESFDKHINDEKQANLESVKGKWQLRVALVTGSIGTIGLIVTQILTLFWK